MDVSRAPHSNSGMNALYLEPFGGLAGDMLLAALLDLEDSRFAFAELEALAAALVPGEARLARTRVQRGGLAATHLEVRTQETDQTPHRHLSDLLPMIDASPLSDRAKERARSTFRRLAEAEARVHGTTPEAVHFHEVGAVDTLIDVCGACHAIELLEVERVFSSRPLVGSGTVRCAHGVMPVPVPAVSELLTGRELELGGEGERLTPTGAALLAEFTADFEPPSAFRASALGYGAGTRDPKVGPPNLVRATLGQVASGATAPSEVLEVRVTLDDMTGEEIGYLTEVLRTAGALEVWTAPVQMKKNRPGTVVTYLCRETERESLETVVFSHSTTLGLRWAKFSRTECEREFAEVELEGHRVRLKVRRRPDGSELTERDISIEYDDLAALALATERPLAYWKPRIFAAYRAGSDPPKAS